MEACRKLAAEETGDGDPLLAACQQLAAEE
jgi:hypothetical protein